MALRIQWDRKPLIARVLGNSKIFKTHFGFTLAEVLITLGIIGVVAAMTMPVLIANIQEKTLLSQLSVAYKLIDEATVKMINENGDTFKDLGQTPEERFREYMRLLPQYIRVIKKCENGKAAGKCNAPTFYNYSASTGKIEPNNYNTTNNKETFVLKNGMSIIFTNIPTNETYAHCELNKNFTYNDNFSGYRSGSGTYGWACGSFYIDINGKKGPNTIAKDVFLFYVAANGIIPAGSSGEGVGVQKFESACGKNGVNTDTKMCTAWALYNNNMDYFKCNGLSWDGKHSCK